MTLEEAQNKINQIPFPVVEEGDVMWYPGKQGIDKPQSEWGYRFIRQGDAWVHHPVEE